MREQRTIQSSIFDIFSKHELGRELKTISVWLDEHYQMLGWVGADLGRHGLKATGRKGLSAETVLRCALLKQHRQLSYEELAFYLSDSVSFRAFARLPVHWTPKKSVLQSTISAISAQTWEAINRCLIGDASKARVESGAMMRLDSTVTAAPIHPPSDSSLLGDSMRVMVRLLRSADALMSGLIWRNHSRRVKRRCQAIAFGRGTDKRKKLYRDLIKITRATLSNLQAAARRLGPEAAVGIEAEFWQAEVKHYLPMIERIIGQAQRRVLNGEQVPAGEKLVSLFEPHTDIIVKGSRDVQYGHKLNLSTGKSGMILDLVIEAGNPADTERFQPMLDRHIKHYGKAPRQSAVDGGYASIANLAYAKDKGVEDAAFHKKRGLNIEDMVKSRWVYRKLRNFRAGIEANISCLKRAYGLGRCTWKGLEHFKAYVWSASVAYNLALFARLKPT
jgi:IS5 family transposase